METENNVSPDNDSDHNESAVDQSTEPVLADEPQHVAQASDEPTLKVVNGGDAPKGNTKSTRAALFVAFAVILFALGILVGIAIHSTSKPKATTSVVVDENKNINTSEYQALFLTNGQVYFGKLSDLNSKYVTMKDIYYLQVQSSNVQPAGGSNSSGSQSQVALAKLGSELHGPEDTMHIASNQVLFWENLKNDSKVVQAIVKNQK